MLQQFTIQYIVSQFCKTCVLLISSSHNTYHNSLHKATAFWKDFCCSLFENSHPATKFIRQLLRRTPVAIFATFCCKYYKKYLLFCNNRYFLELMAGFEPATYWLRSVSGHSACCFLRLFEAFRSVYCGRYALSAPLCPSTHFVVWVTVWVTILRHHTKNFNYSIQRRRI